MLPVATYWSETDLGELLGGQFTSVQIYHLAGILFFTLFGLSALRHGKRAGGWVPAVYGTLAISLFAAALYVGARGFPEHIPDFALRFATPDSLTRLAAVLTLGVWAAVFLSAHWVNDSLAKWWYRVAGLALVGVAGWLATGWFNDDIPEEAKPWTAQTTLIRLGTLAGLGLLAVAFWTRGRHASQHAKWAQRALTPVALAGGLCLYSYWFGYPPSATEIFTPNVGRELLMVLGSIAAGTCLLIAAGAWLMRTRPKPPEPVKPSPPNVTQKPPAKPLPVAILIDSHGRPLPPQ